MNKSKSFSWEKVPKVSISPLGCNILTRLLDESHPLSQGYLSKKTKSTISGVFKSLRELIHLGLVVEIQEDIKAYILNPYRKEEVKRFITGYEFGKNKDIIVAGHSEVYCANVKELPEIFLKHLEQNEKFIHSTPKNWDAYCKRVVDGTIRFHKSKYHCKVYFFVKTLGSDPEIIEMVNVEKVVDLIRKLEERYKGLKIGEYDILASCNWQEYAIQKDPIAQKGVYFGIKYKKIENSFKFDAPEWEEKGIDAPNNIRRIISLREFCINNEIDLLELEEIVEELLISIKKLREKKSKE